MKIKDLVGFQLVDLDNERMIVKKGKQEFTLSFNRDYGDCCGYTNVENALCFDRTNTKRNPVIANVEYSNGDSEDQSDVKITFFGENKKIAEVSADAGSGSGWNYGANVTVSCNALGINETIVQW